MSDVMDMQAAAQKLNPENIEEAARCLTSIASLGLPGDLLSVFLQQLVPLLGESGETNRILANLQRFLTTSRSPQAWLALFEREPDSLTMLVQLFSLSQPMADSLIEDPEAFELLRLTGGQPVEKTVLQDEVLAEVLQASDQRSVMRILRDYRRREILRIAYGDVSLKQSVEIVAEQLSVLTETIVQAALVAAYREVEKKLPVPRHPDGRPVALAVIALGRLGGAEMNYSQDIELVLVHEARSEFKGAAKPREVQYEDFFQRIGQTIVRLLSESTSRGIAYHVDMRWRPHAAQGASLVINYEKVLSYFESSGRTLERQAFIKARAVAGDIELGQQLIRHLQTWIYRRYLMRTDITGLAALKRKIGRRAQQVGNNDRNIALGYGGIRAIEYVIQFLQLLHGGDDPSVRATGTLEAMDRLAQAGCLTAEEHSILSSNYCYLRRVEQLLQVLLDRPPYEIPSDERLVRKVVTKLGYHAHPQSHTHEFSFELQHRRQLNRRIIDHLLNLTLDADAAPLETDLVLDPEPTWEDIRSILAPYGFVDCQAAFRHLQSLSVESIPFLSTRRCRHFLAAIAARLLATIARTPNPDAALISLSRVSDSLGGKAILWELFSMSPPSMELCVRLCAGSPYLASILTSNPGMIDELMDSLMLDSLPKHEELSVALAELCRAAADIAPILHSFKNSMHLRVGVRNVLGKSSIAETHTALSDIAEVCLEQVIAHEFHRLVHQLGLPMHVSADGEKRTAELVVLAVGKLGGREPNYHSDLDVIFLFDEEGQTRSLLPNRRFEATTNRHFFNQLCQRVIHAVTRVGASGKLYDLDVSLRPLGRSGELAISIEDLQNYFADGGGQVWERQALCKARPIWGGVAAQEQAMQCIQRILTTDPRPEQLTAQVWNYRLKLQRDAGERNLKRGPGGTMDVEFLVQLLQLVHAHAHPCILVPGTVEAMQRLREAGVIELGLTKELTEHYQFLRRIESGIRLMNMSARHDLPSQRGELNQLAFLIDGPKWEPNGERGSQLALQCAQARLHCRTIFETVLQPYLSPETDPKNLVSGD